MKHIAILMTCYNRVKTTLACLAYVGAQELDDDVSVDVWLVDDGSSDQTGDVVKKNYPNVHVIKSGGGLFWAKGMHLAWLAASSHQAYDYYLWLNDDLMLYSSAIKDAMDDFSKISVDAVIVGACADSEGSSNLSYGVPSGNGSMIQPDGVKPTCSHCAGMNGNFVLVPKSVFEKAGPICGDFYHGMADWDYGFTLKDLGIHKYCASHIVGVCPQQPVRYFHLKGRNLFGRIKLLFNPKGFCLHDTFLFRLRHFGLLRAVASSCHVIAKVVFAVE